MEREQKGMDKRVKDLLEKVKITAGAAVEAAGKAAESAGKKAGEVVENTKLSLKIFDLNSEIEIAYKEIGRLVYMTHAGLEADAEELTGDVLAVLDHALAEFGAMREREGAHLREDILSRCQTIAGYVSFVEERSPETVSEYREKLTQRIRDLIEGAEVDPQRILTEAAIFADKTAVAEETVRLRSHLSGLEKMLAEKKPVGRKLDFLVQELNREANTIGSKANDYEIARIVVELKAEIEKIREQVQNIE